MEKHKVRSLISYLVAFGVLISLDLLGRFFGTPNIIVFSVVGFLLMFLLWLFIFYNYATLRKNTSFFGIPITVYIITMMEGFFGTVVLILFAAIFFVSFFLYPRIRQNKKKI